MYLKEKLNQHHFDFTAFSCNKRSDDVSARLHLPDPIFKSQSPLWNQNVFSGCVSHPKKGGVNQPAWRTYTYNSYNYIIHTWKGMHSGFPLSSYINMSCINKPQLWGISRLPNWSSPSCISGSGHWQNQAAPGAAEGGESFCVRSENTWYHRGYVHEMILDTWYCHYTALRGNPYSQAENWDSDR